jgi:hypothetical protein
MADSMICAAKIVIARRETVIVPFCSMAKATKVRSSADFGHPPDPNDWP